MSEKLKTIDIKGKEYVQVHTRIAHFNEKYTNGSIVTEMISQPNDVLVMFKCIVTPDIVNLPTRFFTGHSQAKWGEGFINKSSAMENAETSAVGRALGMMGIGITESLCTSDEIEKAKSQEVSEEDFIVVTKEDERKVLCADIKKWMKKSGVTREFILSLYAENETQQSISELSIDLLKEIQDRQEKIEKQFMDFKA